MFRKIIKWGLITIVVGFVAFIAYWIIMFYQAGLFATSSKQELIDNYKNKEKQILDLKRSFNAMVPPNFYVFIEFENSEKIIMKVTEKVGTAKHPILWFQQYDINPYNYVANPKTSIDTTVWGAKITSLNLMEQKLKWTNDTFRKIKTLLDNANCISIDNDEPSEIGFARMGMGEYMYKVFEKPIPDSLKASYNDSCENIYYNDKLVLVWGSGVLGAQCFPDK